MNKVSLRCKKDSCAKFLYASNKMYFELKMLNFLLYLITLVPVIICFLPQSEDNIKLICSISSFGLTLLNEVLSQFKANYKEKAILEHQLYEAEITGSSFSKIEYDRESTNEMQELAIRKGLPSMKRVTEYPISDVPQEITDDYSYLYLCRKSAAIYRYLLSRISVFYLIFIIVFAVVFLGATFSQQASQALYYLVCFWPLLLPIIKATTASKKCVKQCVKICADIDNFFADGDDSVERLARFYYYVQNIEFEMLQVRPTVYKIFQAIYRKGVRVLTDGVTTRFEEAIIELKSKKYYQKGLIAQGSKALITKVDVDLAELKRKEKLLAQRKKISSSESMHLKATEKEHIEEVPLQRTTIKADPVPVKKTPAPKQAPIVKKTTADSIPASVKAVKKVQPVKDDSTPVKATAKKTAASKDDSTPVKATTRKSSTPKDDSTSIKATTAKKTTTSKAEVTATKASTKKTTAAKAEAPKTTRTKKQS